VRWTSARPGFLTYQRTRHVGHVTGGVHIRIAGTQRGVHHDPVAEREPTGLGQLHGRLDAHADHGHVGREFGAVSQYHGGELAVGTPELAYALSEVEGHPVVAVQLGEDGGDLVTEHPAQREGVHLDHLHLGPVPAGGGGHLQADPAGADDDHVRRCLDGIAQRVRLGHGAQARWWASPQRSRRRARRSPTRSI